MTCWQVLGIARTTDVAAIRRAYATQLKAIDTDRDAEGFQRLREARDEAVRRAESAAIEDNAAAEQSDDDGAAWGLGPIDDGDVSDAHVPDRSRPVDVDGRPAETTGATTEPDADDSAWLALYDLLQPEDRDLERDYPDEAQAAEMTALFDAIVGDSRMDRIDFFDRQEHWLAVVIAMAWPTSDPLVERAVAHFDWERRADLVGENGAIGFLVERMRTDAFIHALRQPYHPLKRAWVELNKPANERSFRNPTVRKSDVRTMLERIRTEFPSIEATLDPWRVALWDKANERSRWHRTAIGIVVIILINIALRLPGCDPDRAADPATGTRVEVLADAYQATPFAALVPLDDIFDNNMPLWSKLTAQLNGLRSQGASSAAMIDAVQSTLNAHVNAVATNPPDTLLEPLARLHLEHAVAAKEQGWDACVAVLYNEGTPPPLPDSIAPQVDAIRKAALLVSPPTGERPATDRKASIAPDIMRQIAQNSGLSGTALRDALRNSGDERGRCEARIAAIRVALSLPPAEGVPLLRVLAP